MSIETTYCDDGVIFFGIVFQFILQISTRSKDATNA
jgi:hypothetical protein